MHKPSAWLLSAYRADSHAYWANWLSRELDGFDWRVMELPGRHFRWRIRGNPLSWLHDLDAAAPEILVATSMVDLATIRGLHPALAGVPTIYYFHENQFAYPRGEQQVRSLEPQMVQVYGALAADRCLFNSRYNRDSFLAGVDELLTALPDHVPDGVSERIGARSSILPVPVTPIPPAARNNPRLILWNHRWEYDKAPGLFADAMIELARRGVDFELALLGPRPSRAPAALARLREQLAGHIRYDGRVGKDTYRRIVSGAGIVVSTAIHEFQGIAVLEAVAAGAIPVVPDALCYPEQYAAGYRYPAGDAVRLADTLETWLEVDHRPDIDVAPWLSATLKPEWDQALGSQLVE